MQTLQPELSLIEKVLRNVDSTYYDLYIKIKEWSFSRWENPDIPEQIRHD
jgi:hypothetical protein